MRIVMYGDLNEGSTAFARTDKPTLVMLPALGVPSPNLYFKPLAQALTEAYNVIVVEPLGYGLSQAAATERTVENINRELFDTLESLRIDSCILLAHSISGIYGMEFVHSFSNKVRGFIAIDNTVYDEAFAEGITAEQQYMCRAMQELDSVRKALGGTEAFRQAVCAQPEKYGAVLPNVTGYTYSPDDQEEYWTAFSRSSNPTIQDEIQHMGQALQAIKGRKFPGMLPVLVLISSDNTRMIPFWRTAHEQQLDLSSGRHELQVLEGGHYLWYSNLTQVAEQILNFDKRLHRHSTSQPETGSEC